MESLITASVGIYNAQGVYYIQVITADSYNHYFCKTSEAKARHFSQSEKLEIWDVDELPPGNLLNQ